MKRIFILFLLLGLSAGPAFSQLYYTAIGLRAGKFNTGITFKRFFDSDNSVGLQADLCFTHIADDGFTLKVYYLRQYPFDLPIFQLPLHFVIGGGMHTGYFPMRTQGGGYYKIEDGERVPYNKDVMTVGIDATFQIEYKFPGRKYPFTFGIECNPFYEFVNPGPEWIDFGVAIRYTFR